MDIHRCRFVPFQPQAINALSFSHRSDPNRSTPKDLKLAIGRENGDIELWNPLHGNWIQERVFRGSVGRTVEQVHWTQDVVLPEEETSRLQLEDGPLRLFSSGGSSSITEWDICSGTPKRHAESNSGDIWCFAAQPQWTESQARNNKSQARATTSQLLAAGCADGSIVLFSTADDDLRFDRLLTRPQGRKSRCICITWRDRNTVVAGFEESVIRVFDARNRQVIRTLTLGKARDAAKPLVWTVKCLPNGTIISGDSGGELKIWDRQYFSLVQRLKTHNADILDIATNTAGTVILSCGVDRRTVAYALQSRPTSSISQTWREVRHRRFHEHDVKALASYESKNLSIAVSGGIDTIPVVLPLQTWDEDYHRSLPHLPQRPQMSVSGESRLMITWWARDLSIWHLPSRLDIPTEANSSSNGDHDRKLLAQIKLEGDEYITAADISATGTLIAVATTAAARLFQIRKIVSTAGRTEVKLRSVELPKTVSGQGANLVAFSPDGHWLCTVRLNNVLSIVRIFSTATTVARVDVHANVIKLDRRRRKVHSQSDHVVARRDRYISVVTFSSDSRLLAVGDLSGAIDTWTLEGFERNISSDAPANGEAVSKPESDGDSSDSESDSEDETSTFTVHGQKWIRTPNGSQLPSLGSAILAIGFKPPSKKLHASKVQESGTMKPVVGSIDHIVDAGMLLAVTINHQVVEFDAINCRLSEWSRRNPRSMLPEQFRKIKDRVMGMWIDHRSSKGIYRLWLYGPSFLYMLNMKHDLNTQSKSRSLVKVGRLGKHIIEAPHGHVLALSKEDDEERSRKKRKRSNFGAGDEMKAEQKYSVNAKIMNLATNRQEDADVVMLSSPESGDEADLYDFHKERHDVHLSQEHHSSPMKDGKREQAINETGPYDLEIDEANPSSWHTFQYRAIFGVKALHETSLDQQSADNEEASPEIVIVERPMYDVDLLPRFKDGRNW